MTKLLPELPDDREIRAGGQFLVDSVFVLPLEHRAQSLRMYSFNATIRPEDFLPNSAPSTGFEKQVLRLPRCALRSG
jgi:hypothetical protein